VQWTLASLPTSCSQFSGIRCRGSVVFCMSQRQIAAQRTM
jgi:hypothetical protein